MIFKDEECREQFYQAPLMLQAVVTDFDKLSQFHCSKQAVVTRVRTAVCGDSGVHEAGRAVDLRDEHEDEFLYDHTAREFLVTTLNAKYPRKDGKTTVMWHSFQGAPHHFHVQIPLVWAEKEKENGVS